MPERTITIKGTGKSSGRPDEIHILLTLNARHLQYAETMALAAAQYDALSGALAPLGIARDELKTTHYAVDTVYESEQDERGHYRNRFAGYSCTHRLRIAIAFDTKRLGGVLDAISGSAAEPEINLLFTVRDIEPLKDELLRSAAENAQRKAEILAAASGVRLGRLRGIRYSWGEIDIYSPTRVTREFSMKQSVAASAAMDFQPEDVTLSDTVTFTWEME